MRTSRHCNRLPAARRPVLNPQAHVPGFIATSFVRPRHAMTEAQATAQMAEDMRAGAAREGGVSADDLELLGFTRAQIKLIAPEARKLAHALAVVAP